MKELVLCDNCNPEFVVPLCEKYKLGIEIQGFHEPNRINELDILIEKYNNILPKKTNRYLHAPFADLCFGSITKEIRETTAEYFGLLIGRRLQHKAKELLFITDMFQTHHGRRTGLSVQ